MNFPHSATIQKSAKVGTKYTYANTGSTECFLQPLDSEQSQLYGITYAKAFACYAPLATAVDEGDRVVIEGDTYGVRGIRKHNYGSLAHMRLVLELI